MAATSTRKLQELISIGPAMLRDLDQLGIHSVAQLAKQDPKKIHFPRRGGPSPQPASCRRKVSMVVLEPQTKSQLVI